MKKIMKHMKILLKKIRDLEKNIKRILADHKDKEKTWRQFDETLESWN